MEIARARNFNLPFVYNTSGYEKAESLRTLSGLVDVYLPDFKYADCAVAEKYSNARDYPECAMASLAEMVAQQPEPSFDSDGMMTKGVIVRHLMLPGEYENSRQVIEYLAKTYSDKIYVSIMSQYTPVQKNEQYTNLNERVKRSQYERLIRYATHLGIENGFIQDGQSAEESFIPDFDLQGV
jgi:putative pyruvate formate lyase activating enzyme